MKALPLFHKIQSLSFKDPAMRDFPPRCAAYYHVFCSGQDLIQFFFSFFPCIIAITSYILLRFLLALRKNFPEAII